jgi:hypothetical protein
MISISTIEYDVNGSVSFDSYQDFKDNKARVNRQKVLDGTAYISHRGVSDGDRTLNVSEKITEAQAAIVWYMFKTYTFLHIATADGFFLGVIESLKIDNGAMACVILVKSMLSDPGGI